MGESTLAHIVHLCKRLRKGQLDNEQFITEHLIKLINLSKEKYQKEYVQTDSKKRIAKEVRRKIRDEFERKGQDFNIFDIVKNMTYSLDHYTKMHKKYYGTTLIQYKTELIVKEAKKQLRLGESVVNCAYHCGFNSLQSFSKFFKRHTGLNPIEYLENK